MIEGIPLQQLEIGAALPGRPESSTRSAQHAARLAGFMFLFVIATVLTSSILLNGVTDSTEISDTFRDVSNHTFRVRLSVLLQIVAAISTLILAASLYAITKHRGKNLAALALACRATEAALYVIGITCLLTLVPLSEGVTGGQQAGGLAAARVLGDFLSDVNWLSTNLGATFFSVGNTLYAFLFFKARSIPVPLAVLGMVGSLILVVGLPLLTAAGHRTYDGAAILLWIPIAAFEVSTALWLMIKGIAERAETS